MAAAAQDVVVIVVLREIAAVSVVNVNGAQVVFNRSKVSVSAVEMIQVCVDSDAVEEGVCALRSSVQKTDHALHRPVARSLA